MTKYFTLEDVEGVLALHDPDCILEIDAPKKIVERLSVRTKSEWFPFWCWGEKLTQLHQEWKQCWTLSEIYCPHEGIDRRNEYGMQELQHV